MNKEKIVSTLEVLADKRKEEKKQINEYCPIFAVGEEKTLLLDLNLASSKYEQGYYFNNRVYDEDFVIKDLENIKERISKIVEDPLSPLELDIIERGKSLEKLKFDIKKVGIAYEFTPIAFYLTKQEAINHLKAGIKEYPPKNYVVKTYSIGNSRFNRVDNILEDLLLDINPCYKDLI